MFAAAVTLSDAGRLASMRFPCERPVRLAISSDFERPRDRRASVITAAGLRSAATHRVVGRYQTRRNPLMGCAMGNVNHAIFVLERPRCHPWRHEGRRQPFGLSSATHRSTQRDDVRDPKAREPAQCSGRPLGWTHADHAIGSPVVWSPACPRRKAADICRRLLKNLGFSAFFQFGPDTGGSSATGQD